MGGSRLTPPHDSFVVLDLGPDEPPCRPRRRLFPRRRTDYADDLAPIDLGEDAAYVGKFGIEPGHSNAVGGASVEMTQPRPSQTTVPKRPDKPVRPENSSFR